MKKLLCLSLVFCLMFNAAAFAGEIDLSSMSDEDLLELKKNVDTEVSNRNLNTGFELPIGVYKIGTDIKAGSYVFYDLENLEDPVDKVYGIEIPVSRIAYIEWYESEDDFANHENGDIEGIRPESPYRLSLDDNMILEVSVKPVGIKEAEVIPFAP